jgi:hypothetical protein
VSQKSYDQWLKVFEEKVLTVLNKLNTDIKSEDVTLELEKANKNLQTMVNHYKQIIYDTVSIKIIIIHKIVCEKINILNIHFFNRKQC